MVVLCMVSTKQRIEKLEILRKVTYIENIEIKKDEKCCHHWYLTTDEDIIRGVCRKCGALRVFPNYYHMTPKEYRASMALATKEVMEARHATKDTSLLHKGIHNDEQ